MGLDRYRHFRAAEESIEWSKQATLEFTQLTDKALSSDKSEIIEEIEPGTGVTLVKFRFTEPVPSDVRRKATEALIHARHSFDQAIFAAHEALEPGRNYSNNYPWANGAKDLEGRMRAKGVDSRLWDFFRSQKPYGAPENRAKNADVVRILATIANNKHSIGFNIAGAVHGTQYPAITPGGPDVLVDIQGGVWDDRKQEIELYRKTGRIEQDGPIMIALSLQLTDEKLNHSIPASYAFGLLMSEAKKICAKLEAECHQILGG